MNKFCPNCGAKIKPDDRFCPNCGYDLTKFKQKQSNLTDDTSGSEKPSPEKPKQEPKQPTEEPQPTPSRESYQEESHPNNHSHNAIIVILIIIIICLAGGIWYFYQQNQSTDYQPNSSNNTQTSTSTNSTNDLTTSIGPKQTAAAITYYAAHHGDDSWKALLDGNSDLTVKLDSSDDDLSKLSEPGADMAYEVYGYHDVDSDDDTEFVYTLDKDNTVHIYRISDGLGDSDDNNDPVESVSKSSIINWLNSHHDADKVKSLSNNVEIQQ